MNFFLQQRKFKSDMEEIEYIVDVIMNVPEKPQKNLTLLNNERKEQDNIFVENNINQITKENNDDLENFQQNFHDEKNEKCNENSEINKHNTTEIIEVLNEKIEKNIPDQTIFIDTDEFKKIIDEHKQERSEKSKKERKKINKENENEVFYENNEENPTESENDPLIIKDNLNSPPQENFEKNEVELKNNDFFQQRNLHSGINTNEITIENQNVNDLFTEYKRRNEEIIQKNKKPNWIVLLIRKGFSIIYNIIILLTYFLFLLCAWFFQFIFIKVGLIKLHPEIEYETSEIIIKNGFSLEIHKIKTMDHYVISFWRIYKSTVKNPELLPPIILHHGILSTKLSYLFNGPSNSLAYLLASKGYDVWLTSSRGTLDSTGHKNNEHSSKYWEFSFEDTAKYDIDALMNYIMEQTKFKEVIFIGHSKGATQILVHMGMNPLFRKRVKAFIGLGPIMFNKKNERSLLLLLYKFIPFKSCLLSLAKYTYLWTGLTHKIFNILAGDTKRNHVDLNNLQLLFKKDCENFNQKTIEDYLWTLDGCNILKSKKCGEKLDYYKKNLKNFDKPIYILRGENDKIFTDKDFFELYQILPEKYASFDLIPDYSHFDYIWANDANKHLHPKIYSFLDSLPE